MSRSTNPVLVAPIATVSDRPVYHLPDDDDRPRCGGDDTCYRTVGRDSLDGDARCCRSCDPDVHVETGGGALCDVLAELDPDDVGRPARGD